jgi:hypothetical protein
MGARSDLLDDLVHPIAASGARLGEPRCLPFQVLPVVSGGDACLDGDFLRAHCRWRLALGDDQRSRRRLVAFDRPSALPAERGAVPNALLFGILTEFHMASVVCFVAFCQYLTSFHGNVSHTLCWMIPGRNAKKSAVPTTWM